MNIQFIYQVPHFKLKKTSAIKKWLKEAIHSEKKLCGKIIFTFVSDKEILKINKEFLKHNSYTDIITFDYSEGKKINAEVFISAERVGENAAKLKVSYDEEIRRVMVHGILHLCGFKDKKVKDKKEMRKMEEKYLKNFKS